MTVFQDDRLIGRRIHLQNLNSLDMPGRSTFRLGPLGFPPITQFQLLQEHTELSFFSLHARAHARARGRAAAWEGLPPSTGRTGLPALRRLILQI